MRHPEDILSFWLKEVEPKEWYIGSEGLDARIRDRFGDTWEEARKGGCGAWLRDPRHALAYVILTDQFPRNMFRGDPRAFVTDTVARRAAKTAIGRAWDLRVAEPGRQFFYMPLMHSESLVDQDRAIRMFLLRMPEGGDQNLLHARAHREIIRRFGRFPYRNAALGRESTAAEAAFVAAGGYPALVREMGEEAAPA